VTVPQIITLMWTSYMVGMRLPGERAVYSRLKLAFRGPGPDLRASFYNVANLAKFDERFDAIKVAASLSWRGSTFAEAEMWSFARQDSPSVSGAAMAEVLPRSDALKGRVSLVIGGSRGLGAALVCALASQGSDVLLNYRSSRPEAETLRDTLHHEPGSVSLVQGDAADAAWCDRLRNEIRIRHGGLDILVCNAAPSLHPTGFGLEAMARFRKFVDDALSQAVTPLAACLEMLEARRGWCVAVTLAVSSPAAESFPANWAHYVAAKYAVEGTVRAIAAQAKNTRFLVARPPRLLTDFTNTPMGRHGAIPVEGVAAAIVRRLCNPESAMQWEAMEAFSW
jgi:NAD(P)-dependent dehydrogenase (short-subunit alcohol dehydrogenase family)